MEARLVLLDDREEASALTARLVAGHLETAISQSGKASLMVSGGSTPGAAYRLLSEKPLDWAHVTVGLVDERWVDADHPDSNERLVRAQLLRGSASDANFIPMKTQAGMPDAAVADRRLAYAPHCQPVSSIVLGMGGDGHTASWFPASSGLEAALHPAGGEIIAAIDASNAPVAGAYPMRMTLTAAPVCAAAAAVLLIYGHDKRVVLERSLKGDEATYPVRRAIEGLGRRLTIIWAP